MIVDFSETNKKNNILKIKPETEFEKRVLIGFGMSGKWNIFVDGDVTMVVTDNYTKLRGKGE